MEAGAVAARRPGCSSRPATPASRAIAALANVDRRPTSPTWSRSRRRERVLLTVVGPEAPLAAGIVDAFRAAGLRIFGPTRAAAQLEGSQGLRQGASWRGTGSRPRATGRSPTPRRRTPTSPRRGAPIVVKADGLAAGKGVVVATTRGRGAARRSTGCWSATRLGDGRRARRDRGVPRRRGGELHRAWSTAATCCRSRRPRTTSACCDGDAGPNTGGMGAYSPAPVVTPAMHARIMREVILPTVARHGRRRHPLHGLPLRRADDRRGGHAERARVQLPPRRPGDAADHGAAAERSGRLCWSSGVDGTLDRAEAEWDRRAALGVVLAAAGYPGDAAHGRRDRRTRARERGRPRLHGVPRRHARWSTARRSSPAAACCA